MKEWLHLIGDGTLVYLGSEMNSGDLYKSPSSPKVACHLKSPRCLIFSVNQANIQLWL